MTEVCFTEYQNYNFVKNNFLQRYYSRIYLHSRNTGNTFECLLLKKRVIFIFRSVKSEKERGENPSGQLTWPMVWLTLSSRMIIDWKKSFRWLNFKNSKNCEYYEKVIKELKEPCQARAEVFEYDVKQTREKFKRCTGICKDASVKIKTASGIAWFHEG